MRAPLWMSLAVIAAAAVMAHLHAPRPYLWIFSLGSVAAFAASWVTRARARLVLFNAAGILLVFFALEATLWIRADGKRREQRSGGIVGSFGDGYFDVEHPVLGYGPVPGARCAASRVAPDRVLYDVTYTIGANGLRIAPPVRDDAIGSILFFGGSFMYGEGLEDDEAIPYRVGVATEGRYEVANFGFHGYGPPHMLAALESGWARERIEHPPVVVVVLSPWFHTQRVAGLPWNASGPRYRLDAAGHLTRAGFYRDAVSPFWRRARAHACRSALAQVVVTRLSPKVQQDVDLYLAMLEQARRFVVDTFEGCAFHVIYWPGDAGTDRKVLNALAQRGTTVHLVTDIIEDLEQNGPAYQIDPADSHPNARAADLIARSITSQIVPPAPIDR